MNDLLVSIITPMHNSERMISETIDSVLAQNYTDWEMLVIDDGSTDGSAELVKQYAIKDSRIRLIRQECRGCTAARNRGIEAATGRYFCWLDSDDVWAPTFLAEQIQLLQRTNVRFVCAGYGYIDMDSRPVKQPFIPPKSISFQTELKYCHVGCLTAMYDSALSGKIYLDEALSGYCDDYALWLAILHKNGPGCGNQKVLASYRIANKNSITGRKFRLLIPHFKFHYRYCKLGLFRSCYYTFVWGIGGIRKFFLYNRKTLQ